MELNLNELERLAKAATPGPWHSPGMGEVHDDANDCVIVDVCWREEGSLPDDSVGNGTQEDADFIAAANPAVVLELVRRLREAEARVAELEAERAERERQEPIATVGWDRNFMGVVWHGKDMPEKGVETLLYAAPPVTAPVRLTDEDFARLYDEAGFDPNEMREAAEHMFNAIQSAVLRANGFDIQTAEGT